jgi:hypothetical protein
MTDYNCRVHGHYQDGAEWSTGLHITSNQPLATLLTTWSNAWISAWTNGTYGLQTLYPTTTHMTDWTVYQLDASMRALFKAELTNDQPGTSSDNGLPNDQTITVSKLSPTVAKNGRGFMSLPAPVEGIVVNGTYTSASMTRVKTAVQAVQAAIQADGSTIFVFPELETKGHVMPFTKTVITTLRVALLPGTQVKRQDKSHPGYV